MLHETRTVTIGYRFLFWLESRNTHRILGVMGALLIHALPLSNAGFGRFFPVVSNGIENQSKTIDVSLLPQANVPKLACELTEECARKAELVAGPPAIIEHPLQEAVAAAPASGSAMGLAVNHYFHRSELTKPPRALTNPGIRLPPDDDPRIIGAVTLRLFISEQGAVDDIKIVHSSLPDMYGAASVSGYKNVQFAPGEINGKAVRSQIQIEVDLSTDPGLMKVSHHAG